MVVHEACHIIAWFMYQARGHGKIWKATMQQAGWAAEVYHYYINRRGLYRKNGRDNQRYECDCRNNIKVHKRLSKLVESKTGKIICKMCKQPIRPYVSAKEKEAIAQDKIRRITERLF